MASVKAGKVVKGSGGAYRRGREAGFPLGWSHGHWFGRCESVIRRVMPEPVRRPVHVLFVASGKGYPHKAVDHAVSETLKTVVERVSLALPDQDVIRMAGESRPDLMLALDGMSMPAEKAETVRGMGIRTGVWFIDDPYYTDLTADVALHYDTVFTLERNCVRFYEDKGCSRVFHMPLGVFPDVFRPRNPAISARGDVCFLGTAFWNRVRFFHEAIPLIAHRKLYISGMWWKNRLPEYRRFKSFIHSRDWLDPLQTSERYNANKIVINLHRSHDDDTYNMNRARVAGVSPNPRTFEIAACAALQMTDAREDTSRFYIPGEEIVTFDSPQDLAEKTAYYLEHEEERQAIALRGLYRTMRDHTYLSRLNELLDLALSESPTQQES